MIVRGVPPLKVVKVQAFRANRSKTLHFGVASDGYGIRFLDDAGIPIPPTIWFPMYFSLRFWWSENYLCFRDFFSRPYIFSVIRLTKMVDLNPDIRRTGFFGCSKENSVEFGFTTIQRRHTVKFPRLSGMPFYGIGSPPLHTLPFRLMKSR